MKHVVRHQVTLAGRVVDGATGRPLAGARVELVTVPAAMEPLLAGRRLRHGPDRDRLDNRPDLTRTDAGGTFTFLDLPSGAYGLAASLPGAGRRYGAVKAKAQVKRNKDGDAKPAWVELKLPATTVSGKVTGPGSKPVPLASVQIKGGHEQTFTDSQGRFALAGLESGSRTLVVQARGYTPAEQHASLPKPGTAKTVNVTLTPAAA